VDKIASWTKENPPVETLKERLEKLGVAKEESSELAQEIKATYYDYAKWTDSDVLNISIGQGENAYTTLQMANYTATIANDGVRYKASIVKAVEGKGAIKRKVAKDTKTDKDKIAAVKEGMRRVVANGSLSGMLTGLAESVSAKTGTAEITSYKNPKSEVAYIKEHLSSINPKLSFKKVKKEMKRLMKKYPNIYSSEDTAVRAAVKNLSGKGFNMEKLDAYKSQYDPYTWIIAFAPSDDPEIAVASLVFQGNASAAPGPIVRKVIDGYLDLKAKDEADGKGKIDYNKFLEEKKKQ
jgi:penicillin-binding protein 2